MAPIEPSDTKVRVKLFIAVTLDGFIAREDGSLDWLFELPNPDQTDHGFTKFIADMDTIVMGRKTYEEILGFGVEWPHPECKTYVVTSNPDYLVKTENTFLMNSISTEELSLLRHGSRKNIWLAGGGEVIKHFLNLGEVDEMILNIIPVVLGKGIRLFMEGVAETRYDFEKAESFSTGVTNLHYIKRTNK